MEFLLILIKIKLGISLFNKPPLIGLANIGATCYMNATLQCLSNIDTLTNFFMIYQNIFIQDNMKYDFSNDYSKLIKNLWDDKNEKKYFEPYEFKEKLGNKNPLFSGIAANDSKDLILFIFQELHKELNKPNLNMKLNISNTVYQKRDQRNEKNEYESFKYDYYSNNNKIIQKIFYGEMESFSKCFNCGVILHNFNVFSFLIFPLEKVRQYLININKDGFAKVTLENCFQQYTAEEIMSGQNQMYCNYCHTESNYSMQNKIYKHPEVLVIILNRGKGLEFDVEFEYPIKFTLNNYINLDNNYNYKNLETIEYELISVIAHIGESSMSGHFIAYCKSPVDKKWYKYNDAMISECNNDFNNMNYNNYKSIPYVLFYQTNKKLNSFYPQNNNTINSNINNTIFSNINSNKIVLYFNLVDSKELYLEINENTIFNDAITLLKKIYQLPENNYKFYNIYNIEIDRSKSIKDNLLKNNDNIYIK